MPLQTRSSKSPDLAREIGDRVGKPLSCTAWGLIYSNAGDKEMARENFERLYGSQEIADRSGEAGSFFQLGATGCCSGTKIQEGLRLMALLP